MPLAFYLTRRDGAGLGGHECRESASASINGEWQRPDSGITTAMYVSVSGNYTPRIVDNMAAYMDELRTIFQTQCAITVEQDQGNGFNPGRRIVTSITWDTPVTESKHLWWWVALIQRLAVQCKPVNNPTILGLLKRFENSDEYSAFAESDTCARMIDLWLAMCEKPETVTKISQWLATTTNIYHGPAIAHSNI